MGLKENHRRLQKPPEDERKGDHTPQHRMTLIKDIMRINSLRDYDNNPFPGIV